MTKIVVSARCLDVLAAQSLLDGHENFAPVLKPGAFEDSYLMTINQATHFALVEESREGETYSEIIIRLFYAGNLTMRPL